MIAAAMERVKRKGGNRRGTEGIGMKESKPRVREVRQTEDRFLGSDLFDARTHTMPPRNGKGPHREAARDVPVYHKCVLLVAAAGPAGTAAALAAARTGADVVVI